MKPRQSGIPTPGRSAIPTPGRPRSTSTNQNVDPSKSDSEFATKAFADAIKANDPALHRANRASDLSNVSLSPLSASYSFSGRPSSAASSSSTTSQPKRPKTPVSARPSSRQSDLFARSSSRAGSRSFEVGDNVRIESLGFEGTLRYVGDIEGKPGLWAGVELGPGFAGKGKNNGTAAGQVAKVYFTCPEKCGVFVATTKLSAPTVGPGAVSHRPSSVASSRGGRITPSLSGRITPSTSLKNTRATPAPTSGRVTPSGRITPSTSTDTPAARAARLRAMTSKSNNNTTPTASRTSLADKITSGSRASKYMSMTAKQLSSINGNDATTPARTTNSSSPARQTRTLVSPTRSTTSSPFSTPKPRISTIAPGTPRGRIPSAVAMPPPPSPGSKTEEDLAPSSTDLISRGKALQDKITSLTSGKTSTPTSAASWAAPPSPRRPGSSASVRSSTTTSDHTDQLQSRIDALEYENERLRHLSSVPPSADPELTLKLQSLETSYAAANLQISELQASVSSANSSVAERDITIQSFKDTEQVWQSELTELKRSSKLADDEMVELKRKVESSDETIKSLREMINEKSSTEDMNGKLLSARTAEWEAAESRLKKIVVDLEDEKRDLSSMVDELRHAGQETIALYEERLRASDAQRYELEDRVIDLEAKLSTAHSTAPETSPAPPTTTQIDNETLRDQVVHLQKKVGTLEDMIEDSRATAEREEAAIRERMKKVKEREDAMKKELSEGRKEAERAVRGETSARARIEEIEEALRESTSALENAQAEVEGLRAELDNLNAFVANNANGDHSDMIRTLESQNLSYKRRLEDQESALQLAHQENDDQSQELEQLRKKVGMVNGVHSPAKQELQNAREEIKGLKHIVQELQKESVANTQQNRLLESENQLLKSETDQLRQEVRILEENLDTNLDEQDSSGGDDSLRRLLREQKSEVEHLRKKLADADMKQARITHDLNKEISELEALVESKIYREDELEQEIEKLKDKLSRQKKSSKSSIETTDSYHRARTSSTATNEAVCEICERPGHDIFSCDLLKDETTPSVASHNSSSDLFCEECEEHGHLAAECPHSLDVF